MKSENELKEAMKQMLGADICINELEAMIAARLLDLHEGVTHDPQLSYQITPAYKKQVVKALAMAEYDFTLDDCMVYVNLTPQ